MIRNNIENLKETDFYSLILFTLFKMTDNPEYYSISQLSYVLDKDNLLNLCAYFGGQTIKIPTTHELESLVYALLLYQHVKIDGMEYEKALNLIGHESEELREVKKNYKHICNIMSKYSFVPQEKMK